MYTSVLPFTSHSNDLPADPTFDASIALLFTEGYCFVTNRARRLDSDIFRTRIFLRKAICTYGSEAAEQFYSPGRFTRRGALPLFALALIQDLGSVMVLNDEDHRRRKAMFMEMMSPEALVNIGELTMKHWRKSVNEWQNRARVELFREAHVPLTAAICEWAGLRPQEWEIRLRAREFEAMVEGTGSIGPRNWHGHWMRASTESWARQVIRKVRRGELVVPDNSPVNRICTFRNSAGNFLDVHSAAVELLNVLRPSVAIARYAAFIAIALHDYPIWRDRLGGSDEYLGMFVDEVRRYYPFIPIIGGRVLKQFRWRGHDFTKGEWVLFDIYGTNQDPRIWGDPHNFRPQRFSERSFGPYDLVSHGAGDRHLTHRCPGEWITVEQMKAITRCLVREMQYEVPAQDLSIDYSRIPALPKSGFVLTRIRPKLGLRE
jgi:fatty-acid peroxygenase